MKKIQTAISKSIGNHEINILRKIEPPSFSGLADIETPLLYSLSIKFGSEGANVLKVEHSRFAIDLSASVAKLYITIETQNQNHLKKIKEKIKKKGFPVTEEGLI